MSSSPRSPFGHEARVRVLHGSGRYVATMRIERVGDFTLGWGESLVWDDRRQRLFFVDCAAHTLHWLEDDGDELHTLALPSMAAGIVPTEDGTLVACL